MFDRLRTGEEVLSDVALCCQYVRHARHRSLKRREEKCVYVQCYELVSPVAGNQIIFRRYSEQLKWNDKN